MKIALRVLFPLVFILIVFAIIAPTPADAQCTPRADWATYTVVRGDTLSNIARRYNVSLGDLMRGNCLTATRILVGQRLRVPGSVTATAGAPLQVEAPGGTFGATVTYRQFERGFMIWRYDNGPIYVFTDAGTVRSYPLSQWGGLPVPPNPPDQPTSGLYRPGFGFGQLWHNFPVVRQELGWATTAIEGSYNVYFNTPAYGSFFTMTLWDGRLIRVNLVGTWARIDTTPTATYTGQPAQTVGATFQAFERGFMVWRADTGEIRVFFDQGEDRGLVNIVPLSRYAGLPLTGGFTAPAGRFVPNNGFGKIWRNDQETRNRIGYATSGESGYTMALVQSGGRIVGFSLPDQRFVYGDESTGSWFIAGDFYAPTATTTYTPTATGPTPVPSATYTPTPTLTVIPSATLRGDEPLVGSTYQAFENGFMLWRADTGDIWVYAGQATGEMLVFSNAIYASLPINRRLQPPPGRLRPDNGFGRVWSNFPVVRERLGWATGSEQGYLSLMRNQPNGQTWSFQLPDGRFVTQVSANQWRIDGTAPTSVPPTATSNAPLEVTQTASYQPFEGGFMIWLSGGGQIIVYTNVGSQVIILQPQQYGDLPIDTRTQPPAGRFRPEAGFARVWSNFPAVRQGLGWALTPNEFGYNATLSIPPGSSAFVRITLPEGGAVLEQVEGGQWRVTGTLAPVPTAATPSVTASPTLTPTLTPTHTATATAVQISTQATFQCFETGYMLLREDTGQVLALVGRDGGTLGFVERAQYENIGNQLFVPPRPGLLMPVNIIGRVWGLAGADGDLPRFIGWATRDEETYTASVNVVEPNVLETISLPGGSIAELRWRGLTWALVPGSSAPACP
ncbi:MAG: LysM peptidoglycan-binding domain-containing protein [Chloroflexota bacterium]|nr:LysM peptidoglycan-binding domain-containing protein [Chloroflexota bacterium]